MPRLSVETRKRVVLLKESGYSVKDVLKRLEEEDIPVGRTAVFNLLGKYKKYGSVADLKKARPPKKLSKEQYIFIDNAMIENDELTSRQLRDLVEERWPEIKASLSTYKRARKDLGWVATRPKYCQLIREANQAKRLLWCEERVKEKDQFQDVIWTDECSVQQDSHGRLCFRRVKEPRKLKPKPKHPVKVHVWAGISCRGATQILIFTGIMTAVRYCLILEAGLLPFIKSKFPEGARFQQDNDPKHSSNYTKNFLSSSGINWWRTPAESPDLNPIENVWASLKYYLRHHFKPRDLNSLIEGILSFWKTMTPQVCRRYIKHLHKVIPKVIEVNGAASGY